MALIFFTEERVIDQLDLDSSWENSPTITYGFPQNPWAGADEDFGFSPLVPSQQAAATLAIALWDDLIAPNFQFQPNAGNNSNIEFSNTTTNIGYAHTYIPGIDALAGSVWLNPLYDASWGTNNLIRPQVGQHGFTAIVHEAGHSLGLAHMGNYNSFAAYPRNASSVQDDELYTVMSYFDPRDTGSADWVASDGNYYHPQTPMLNDILAIQFIYGADTTTRTGDTVYGFNSNVSGIAAAVLDFHQNPHPILAIYDAGGIDTLDLSGFSTPSNINLEPGTFSSADAMTNNIAIARGTLIENAVGGPANDVIRGNLLDNSLTGGGGADQLYGGAGDDRLFGGAGSDYLDGGSGIDQAIFAGAYSSFTITAGPNEVVITSVSGSQTDTLTNVEEFVFTDVTLTLADITGDDSIRVSIGRVSAVHLEGDGDVTVFTFAVSLTERAPTSMSVDYTVTGSSASPASESDFAGGVLPSGTINFEAGEALVMLTIEVSGDMEVEMDEVFTVTLSSPSEGLKIHTATATGSITDDDFDRPIVTIEAATLSRTEGNEGTTVSFTFNVTLDHASIDEESVSFTVTGVSDSPAGILDFSEDAVLAGTVTFAPGETSKQIVIEVAGDNVAERDEFFAVTLSDPSSGIDIGVASATARIRDDDALSADIDDFADNASTLGLISVNGAGSLGEINISGDRDWFRVTLEQGHVYTFELFGSGDNPLGDPFLTLYDAGGNRVAFNDDGLGFLDAALEFVVMESGVYFVEARDFASDTGTYTVRATAVGVDDFAGDVSTTGALTPGATVGGEIEQEFDIDWFRVELDAGETYLFTLTGDTLADPLLILWDANANFVTFDDDSGPGLNSALLFTSQGGGTYYLDVSDFSGSTGTYTLEMIAGAQPDLAAGVATTGVITVDGAPQTSRIEQPFDSDWFRVELQAGQTYEFTLTRTGGEGLNDPYLNLFDADGNFLTFDDDSGGDLNSSLIFTADTGGTYYLGAQDFYGEIGDYEIAAASKDLTDDFAGDPSTSGTVTPGEAAVQGEIEISFDSDWFQVVLEEGKTYQFSLTSAEPAPDGLDDPFLALFDGYGNVVALDDDSGGNFNSQLLFSAATSGTYYLAAEDYFSGTGTYLISAVELGETDDFPADTTTAGIVNIEGLFSNGRIGQPEDQDLFRVNLIGNQSYTFFVFPAGGGGGLPNPVLSLVDAEGNLLAAGEEDFDGTVVRYLAAEGGTAFLQVQAGDGVATGNYQLGGLRGLIGAEVDDELEGSGGGDFIDGNTGNDVLRGREGDDRLFGWDGADRLFGGAGNDVLDGEYGADIFYGGNGDDIYWLDKEDLRLTETPAGLIWQAPVFENDLPDILYGDLVALNFAQLSESGDPNAADAPFFFAPEHIEDIRVVNDGGARVRGNSGDNVIIGNHAPNNLIGGAGNDVLFGYGGSDVIKGNQGDDIINALDFESDSLRGRAGNDVYFIDQFDQILEGPGEGTDTVVVVDGFFSGYGGVNTYVLPDPADFFNTGWIENVAFYGAYGAANFVGNALDNVLAGGPNADVFFGAGGLDTYYGWFGSDTYFLTADDLVFSNVGGLLVGQARVFEPFTGEAEDFDAVKLFLEGAPGGGNANAPGAGFFFAPANVEDIFLYGDGGLRIRGNELDNIIYGDAGDNNLTGAGGDDVLYGYGGEDILKGNAGDDWLFATDNEADSLRGRGGNDFYFIDEQDQYLEAAGEGRDTLIVSGNLFGGAFEDGRINFSLPAPEDFFGAGEFENLIYISDSIGGRLGGNRLDNVILGDLGDDIISGGEGVDKLGGGPGADQFVFDTPPGEGNVDVVTDFLPGEDRIMLDSEVFTEAGAEGTLTTAAFESGPGLTEAATPTGRIIYDTTSGNLYYDPDGNESSGDSVLFATLASLPEGLTATAFVVI